MLLLSYLIEAYILTQHALPSPLKNLLPILPSDIAQLQPALFSIATCHVIADDGDARKNVEEGGLGYKGICTTLEGMCMQIREWNMERAGISRAKEQQSLDKAVNGEMETGNNTIL